VREFVEKLLLGHGTPFFVQAGMIPHGVAPIHAVVGDGVRAGPRGSGFSLPKVDPRVSCWTGSPVARRRMEVIGMPRLFRKVQKKAALPPGTIEYVGERRTERVRITVFDFDGTRLEERELASVDECLPYRDTPRVSWINIDGLRDTASLEKLGAHFGLHPLVLEDIAHTHQRPKVEDHQDYLYIVLKMLEYPEGQAEVSSDQVSIILGSNFVLSFQERAGDVWDPIRERIRTGAGRIRHAGSDYLAYRLMDAIVDHYFVVLERIGDELEGLADEVAERPTSASLQRIHELKREMIFLRRQIWPMREVTATLERAESKLIKKVTVVYLRDVYDHSVQLIEAMESYRDLVSGMQDLYLSTVSNRLNAVMKILTLFAAIFAPLTFLVGIYGMNFRYMPELGWKLGYPMFWVVTVVLTLTMIAVFRRKGWF
jgi:magnesium transporter